MKKFIKTGQKASPRSQPIIDFQNERVEMYVAREGMEEGVERGRGRRFIRWDFSRRYVGSKSHTFCHGKV